jgi:exonuclease VII large subunit
VKPFVISCFGAGLALASAQPSAAAPILWPSEHPALIRVASDDFAAKKDEYVRDAKRELDEWNDKLRRHSEHASKDVDEAWSKTKQAAHQLQTASADQWGRAKRGYETAMQGLKDRWHKIHPEDE